MTACIVLQGAGTLLISNSGFVDNILHKITGQWFLDDWLGHMCFIGAIAMLVIHAMTRLMPLAALRTIYRQRVELPFTVVYALTLMSLFWSPSADIHDDEHNLLDIPADDWWLKLYWVVLPISMIYLLIFTGQQFARIRRDRRSRVCANFYLTCIGLAVIGCAARTATIFGDRDEDLVGGEMLWLCAVVSTCLMSLIAAYSWRRKMPPTQPKIRRPTYDPTTT